MRFRSIVILTGAGISAESGLGTFRDKDGLWTQYDLNDVATPEGFARNPVLVHDFYNARRQNLIEAVPNAAHAALADLERGWDGDFLLVTQNVDDLHERAGSEKVLHMHGELLKVRCDSCGSIAVHRDSLDPGSRCGVCGTTGRMRPHVVWFGEMPLYMEMIYTALDRCDLFVSIGTSGQVYPAAGFVAEVRNRGRAHTVELNLDPSDGASLFAEKLFGPATEVVPAFVERLLQPAA